MRNKKVIIFIILSALAMGLLSSCAIDRKCPAYSKVEANQPTDKTV